MIDTVDTDILECLNVEEPLSVLDLKLEVLEETVDDCFDDYIDIAYADILDVLNPRQSKEEEHKRLLLLNSRIFDNKIVYTKFVDFINNNISNFGEEDFDRDDAKINARREFLTSVDKRALKILNPRFKELEDVYNIKIDYEA